MQVRLKSQLLALVAAGAVSIPAIAEDAEAQAETPAVENQEAETESTPKAPLSESAQQVKRLMELLVSEKVISQEAAQAYQEQLQDEADVEAEQEAEAQAKIEAEEAEAAAYQGLRVTHVPEFVRDQIRDEVRLGMQEDVVNAVMSQAKTEAWGVPYSWPSWLKSVKVTSDLRVRIESELFGDDNVSTNNPIPGQSPYLDINRINDRGSFDGNDPRDFLNVEKDRHRMRIRARLGFKTKISEMLSSEFRLATGNTGTPVSTNQTLGDEFNNYTITFDRAAFIWKDQDLDAYPWLDFYAGRIKNPFMKTDLVWDSDINLDGLAFTYRYNLSGGDDLFSMDQRDKTLFLTAGAFPIAEFELSSDDRWLLGAQIGNEYILDDQTTIRFALAYYDFLNMEGARNTLDQNLTDFTAPDFVQKGNTLVNIAFSSGPFDRKFAYAADYDLVNFTARIDIASFAPERLIIDLDYVENIGFDADDVEQALVESGDTVTEVEDRTSGYQIKVLYGWPSISHYRDWNLQFAYKYLEADAVVDAFTDSDFHGGGTDAQGWWVKGSYGIEENTALSLKYISASEIDLGQLDISHVQLDLTTKF